MVRSYSGYGLGIMYYVLKKKKTNSLNIKGFLSDEPIKTQWAGS